MLDMSTKMEKLNFEEEKNCGLSDKAFILDLSVPKVNIKLVLDCFDSKLWVIHILGVQRPL